MTTSNSKPVWDLRRTNDPDSPRSNSETVERMAWEMRARSGGELPYSFCVEQVKRQLAGKAAPYDEPVFGKPPMMPASVFHAWALRD